MQRILIVDDDHISAKFLRFLLEGEGYTVTTTESAVTALEALDHNAYDLVILDVVMPDMDGLELCLRIRVTSHVPILLLSVRGNVDDIVRGLRVGADDYLAKPFDLDELLARIWVLLRRTSGLPQSDLQLRHDDLTLDLSRSSVVLHRSGKLVRLTATEARLLHTLLMNAGRSMDRKALELKMRGSDSEYAGNGNRLDVYIRRLRNKLEEDPADPQLIQTVRGLGYRFGPCTAHATAVQTETTMQPLF